MLNFYVTLWNVLKLASNTKVLNIAVSDHPFAKFSLVSILKIFSFFGVFFCHPIWDDLKFQLGKDIVARI